MFLATLLIDIFAEYGRVNTKRTKYLRTKDEKNEVSGISMVLKKIYVCA